MAKRKRRRRGGRTGLAGVSIGALQAEIERRRQKSGALHRVRDRLLRRLTKIEARIVAAGGELVKAVHAQKGKRTRGRNPMSLVETLQKVLKTKTMSVTDAAAAAQRAGYKSISKTFRTIVNQALIKNSDKFKKVSRGNYRAN